MSSRGACRENGCVISLQAPSGCPKCATVVHAVGDGGYGCGVKLDVYRSCSWVEKREVLGTFWHRGRTGSAKITTAAAQYGPWAVVCLVVLALELVPVIALGFSHAQALALIGVALEIVVLLSLWLAVVRTSDLRAAAISAATS